MDKRYVVRFNDGYFAGNFNMNDREGIIGWIGYKSGAEVFKHYEEAEKLVEWLKENKIDGVIEGDDKK